MLACAPRPPFQFARLGLNINDLTGGVITDVGPLVDDSANPYALTGIRFQPGTGTLYGVTNNHSATDPQWLVRIDPTTALVTPIGALNTANANDLGDIAFDPTSGILYGANVFRGALYTVNLSTGAATRISSANFITPQDGSGHGLAIANDGTAYTTPDNYNGHLFTYDLTTGSATSIASLTGATLHGSFNALAFDEELPTLYGVNNDFGSPSHTFLDTIDTSTGVVTPLGASVNNLDAIAFFTPATVPEPSSIVLFGLGGLSLIGYGWKRRRASK